MLVTKDKYLNKWVVWLKKGSLFIPVYKARTKKECKEWKEKNEKRVIRKNSF